jgi:hypothetical protein
MKFWGMLAAVFLLASLPLKAQQEPSPAENQPPSATSAAQPPSPASPSSSAIPDLTPGPDGKLSQQQMQNLFRIVGEKDMENHKRERDYTYVEREIQNNLDGKGQVKSKEIKTYEILDIYGEQVQRLIAKDDKPLDTKDAAKEEEKIQKIIDKRKNESEEDRRKREQKEEKDREDDRKFETEVADAFNFKLVGTELVDGREAWVIDGEPRPGFEPHTKGAKFLSKFRGRVWIDKTDLQLTRMDIEAIDTVSIGLVLARIHRGTRVTLEQTRVNEEVWLPEHVTFKLDARLALLKGYKIDGEQTYRDYKKFRTSTKIVGMGEVKEQPAAEQP